MSETKSPAANPEARAEKEFHIPIEPFQGTPDEIERQWFEQVYQGRGDSMRQLTWRAVIMGSLLGGVLSLTNLYIGLKAGWGFGVAITACILSYSIWAALLKIRIARTPMTILENNCMQSTASSAGYSTGGTLISAFAAYILLNGHPLPIGLTLAWVFFLAVLGVTMAVPMKRQMINVEQLRFPSGIAAAETLQALHAHGAKGLRAARALGIAGVVAAVDKFWAEGLGLVNQHWEKFSSAALLERLQTALFGGGIAVWKGRTVMFSWDAIFIAAGAITGLRVCTTMLISGTLCWAVFVPALQERGLTSRFSSSGFKSDEAQAAFVGKLRAGDEPVSQSLWAALPETTRRALADTNLTAAATAAVLLPALDHLLAGPVIFDAQRFDNVDLTPETSALLARRSAGGSQVRLNRLLLESAYPKEISKSSGFRALVQWTLWGGTACMVTGGILSFLMQWRSVLRAFGSLGKVFSRGKGSVDAMDAIETPMSWFAIGQIISLIALAWLGKVSFDMPWWQSALAVVLSFGLALVACRITGETDTTPIGAMGKVTQLTFGALNPGNINVNLMSANITAAAAGSSADLLTDLKSGYLLGAHPRKQFLAQFAGIFIGTVVTVLSFSVLVPDASVLGSEKFPAPAAQTWAAVAKALSKGLEVLEPLKVWSIAIGAAVGILFTLLPLWLPKQQKHLPSAAAFGLSWVFDWYYGVLFFIGAVIGWAVEAKSPETAKEFTFPVASGIIAGGSLMGVLIIFWGNGLDMLRAFFGH